LVDIKRILAKIFLVLKNKKNKKRVRYEDIYM